MLGEGDRRTSGLGDVAGTEPGQFDGGLPASGDLAGVGGLRVGISPGTSGVDRLGLEPDPTRR
jgi:hypothetical protein